MRTETIALWEVTPGTTESVVPYLVHYTPDEAKTTAAVLIIPGSGYFHLPSNPVQEGARVAEYLCREGMHVFVLIYRVAPDAYPDPLLDGRRAMRYIRYHAAKLGIDTARIGIGGDSAGSTLAVGVCRMAQERRHPVRFAFQMLPYPYLDARNNSASCKQYTDTPMWNSSLSSRIAPMTRADRSRPDYVWYSPVEAECFAGLPPAYIETAEFDCLHDDGILYAEQLRAAGIAVTLNETRGTMHGFDIVQHAKTTKEALAARIAFMKARFDETETGKE